MTIVLAALLLAAAPPRSVADADRAFSAAAQAGSQWQAFHDAAAPDAIVYAPGPVNARTFFAGRDDLPQKLIWRPSHTITSCDGTLGYSTGPWTRGSDAGSFSTVWRHYPDGWRWLYDNGHEGTAPPAAPLVEDRAACAGPAGVPRLFDDVVTPEARSIASLKAGALAGLIVSADAGMPGAMRLGPASTDGASADRTLRWRISPVLGDKANTRLLRIWSWDGRRYRLAVLDYSDGR